MSDYEVDFQPDCMICGEQLFEDDLDNALANPGAENYACMRCLAAADSLGHGFED